MLIIPSIDLIDGKCVRLVEGDYRRRTEYPADPAAIVKGYCDAGLPLIHCVDLDGARTGHVANWTVIEKLVRIPGVRLQVGGGIRQSADVERLISLGVERCVVGSILAGDCAAAREWCETYGASRFCAAVDIRDGKAAISGWTETAARSPSDIIEMVSDWGIRWILSTDISRDGTLAGPNTAMYSELVRSYPRVRWIASGGIGSAGDIRGLRRTGVGGVVVGKALLDGRITAAELVKEQGC